MIEKRKKIYIFVFFIIFMSICFFLVLNIKAQSTTHYISDFDTLIESIELSKYEEYSDDTYLLVNDIYLSDDDYTKLNYKPISFGNKDIPFSGNFDGQGHFISGLQYDSSNGAVSDSGLFSYTNSANIKNLEIRNSKIDAAFRGGIVIGQATKTLLDNVIVNDSKISLAAYNNIVNLVTDGGIVGGGIIGVAYESILYNCETNNVTVITNNTVGVSALGGKGIILGALIGSSDNTTIEYSRVNGGLVKAYYDVAVGALGGNTLYTGGISGEIKNGSKVIDCYSTAELNFYCATYVSVGAGNTGHAGGIAAVAYGNNCEVIRSHYAGKMTSEQYNAVLVIPIIQKNKNLSGIIDVFDGGSIVSSYFKRSITGNVNTLGNDNTTSQYGPQSDDRYVDMNFWSTYGYDFTGAYNRESSYNAEHSNKWVMNYERGYPIHGKSAAVTLNFPQAGKAMIGESELVATSVSTSNPYVFAVQGFNTSEYTTTIKAIPYEGYKFVKWHIVPNTTATSTNQNSNYFKKIIADDTNIISLKPEYNVPNLKDNDLYIAHYKALVLFHDINGNVIDKTTGEISTETSDDWYDYEDKLPNVKPAALPSSSNASFVGWTTEKSKEAGGGYSAIDSVKLTELISNKLFYYPDDLITSTLQLYPIYADAITNINTVFEGNENDSLDNVTLRSGVGYTTIEANNGKIILNVIGYGENGNFPDGYRFLGWYKDGYLVSKNKKYTLENIDILTTETYLARFEYRVDYYVRAYGQGSSNFQDSSLFASLWQEYNSKFNENVTYSYFRENVLHWGTSHVEHTEETNVDKFSGSITSPTSVYSHNYSVATGGSSNIAVLMDTDFPGSGTIVGKTGGVQSAKYTFTTTSNRYHLNFWTLERKNSNWTYSDNPMETGFLNVASSAVYKGRAMVTADINFFKKNNTYTTVLRRYNSPILLDNDTTYTYKYPHYSTTTTVATSTEDDNKISDTITLNASPSASEMFVDGYLFIGWIDGSRIKPDSTEWNYIYDVKGDSYCSSNKEKVLPYLLTIDSSVTEAHDIYPVYVKYNFDFTTNIKELGVPSSINIPNDITYTKQIETNGTLTLTLTADTDMPITNSSDKFYELISIDVYKDSMFIETITPLEDGIVESIVNYNIEAGPMYVFVANYRPFIVLYNINDTTQQIQLYEGGDVITNMPLPTYDLKNDIDSGGGIYTFIGWSSTIPENKYHKYNSISEYQTSNIETVSENTMVTNSIELYPIYVKIDKKINSNIDNILTTPDDIRYVDRERVNIVSLVAKNVAGYDFVGWYKDYNSLEDTGTLISNNDVYYLEYNEIFDQTVFTAVYREIYTINYHNNNNEIIYTAIVYQDDNRTFVSNTTIDEQTYENPIDIEAFSIIEEQLPINKIFQTWQWSNNGQILRWNDFKNLSIRDIMNNNNIESIDLYPIIRHVTVFDSYNNKLSLTSNKPDIVLGSVKDEIKVFFNDIEYNQSSLTVHIEDLCYLNDGYSVNNIEEFNVSLYTSPTINESALSVSLTNNSGNALFKLFGKLTINISSNSEFKDVVVLNIVNKNDISQIIKTIMIEPNNLETIIFPYGEYEIICDNNWSWRYNLNSEKFKLSNLNMNTDVIMKINQTNNKWFNFTAKRKNIFK